MHLQVFCRYVRKPECGHCERDNCGYVCAWGKGISTDCILHYAVARFLDWVSYVYFRDAMMDIGAYF